MENDVLVHVRERHATHFGLHLRRLRCLQLPVGNTTFHGQIGHFLFSFQCAHVRRAKRVNHLVDRNANAICSGGTEGVVCGRGKHIQPELCRRGCAQTRSHVVL